MSFFDKKEEVIDIQLTQYGKALLASGKFRPYSYEFYDDDVIYNIEHIGKIEAQNDIQDRILSSAKKKPAISIYGSETKVQETNYLGAQKDGKQQLSPNSVDNDLLLRDKITTYATARQELPFMSVSIAGGASIISEIVTKTTSSYANTANDNIKVKIGITRNDNGTYHEPSALVVLMEEHLEFCKDEEFEVKFYEIEKETDKRGNLVEKLTELYLNSPNPQNAMLSNRFVLLVDDQLDTESISIEPREGCVGNTGLEAEREEEAQETDFYQDINIDPPDCED